MVHVCGMHLQLVVVGIGVTPRAPILFFDVRRFLDLSLSAERSAETVQ